MKSRLIATKKKHPRIKAVVTAGPTVEPIDPVRFLSNFSTGEMGYQIARACCEAGFETVLITGPVSVAPPQGAKTVRVNTAREMMANVLKHIKDAHCLIMAAAVCDFRPEKVSAAKIKKTARMTLRLVKNPDILSEAGKKKGLIKIGFALETGRAVENAIGKLKAKSLDLIALNTKCGTENPFGSGKKNFTLIDREMRVRKLKRISKAHLARELVAEVERLIG